jgi:hypothetical protein
MLGIPQDVGNGITTNFLGKVVLLYAEPKRLERRRVEPSTEE